MSLVIFELFTLQRGRDKGKQLTELYTSIYTLGFYHELHPKRDKCVIIIKYSVVKNRLHLITIFIFTVRVTTSNGRVGQQYISKTKLVEEIFSCNDAKSNKIKNKNDFEQKIVILFQIINHRLFLLYIGVDKDRVITTCLHRNRC
ncbi:hypothetical protein RCL_jg10450.t1 [Rhizophagus clarus]|uniref:Uncharacterized protein n=1 Tax=Rhizophagus clarus TaxID=94130 RepID=A0A8H3KXL5_9GLOM|nr:hypothetical protein RCL_jg10450.t1 [Rhizophagus clarus]